MDISVLNKICKRLDSYQNEIIELQKNLTALPALGPQNGGEGEQKKAEFIATYLKDNLNCEHLDHYNAPDERVPDGYRPNLIAKFPGSPGARTVWIMSHMDVVPPGDLSKWQGDPWTVRVEGDKIYGRGTEDNQQGIVSSLVTAKAFVDEGVQPAQNLGLVFAADEETGNQYGVQHLLNNHKEIFADHDYIIIPDAGNSDGTLIETAEKSIIWFKFKVTGKQTHASTPERGVNALRAAANLIVKLNNLYTIYATSDPVFDPPISTFEATKMEPNVPNVNTIPGEAIFYCDCRVLPNYDVEQLHANIQRTCKEVETRHKVSVEISVEQELRAAPPTPPDAPVVKSVERAISEIRKIKATPKGIGGGTVAAFFRQAGFDTVVWATQDEVAHEPNEYAKISNIINDAKVFAHVALQD